MTGNASSIPPRLPDLSQVLRRVSSSGYVQIGMVRCTMVCLSYRGYWASKGRPSEKGMYEDASAALQWISDLHAETYAGEDAAVVPLVLLWGQSIGAAIATRLAAQAGAQAGQQAGPHAGAQAGAKAGAQAGAQAGARACGSANGLTVDGVILETPFLSARALLAAIYPQKWMPYKHLWPFLWNRLDSEEHVEEIAARQGRRRRSTAPDILIVEAGRDALVPAEHGQKLFQTCLKLGLVAEKRSVQGAYHNQVMAKDEGRVIVSDFILSRIERLVE